MVKAVLISDTHNFDIETILGGVKADLLIHCGDFSFSGSFKEINSFIQDIKSIRKNFDQVLWTPGNHEIGLQANTQFIREIEEETNSTCLIDDTYNYLGLRIYGSPYTPKFGNWAYSYDRGSNRWNIPSNLDLLFTHGPPYGILDRCPSGNVGCQDLLKEVLRKTPKHHAFGHIHESHGAYHNFYNVSICDGLYNPVNRPTILML